MSGKSKSEAMKNAGKAAEEQSTDDASGKASCPLKEKEWIEIELLSSDDAPMRDVECVITDAKGSEHKGKTDAKGLMKISGLPVGDCTMSFPKLDQDACGTEPEKKEG